MLYQKNCQKVITRKLEKNTTVRNQVKTAVNRLRKQYEKGISIQAKENTKAIWNYIESKTKVKEGIGELHIQGRIRGGGAHLTCPPPL